jgi:hypothetical protein
MRQELPRCSFKRANSCLNVPIPIYTSQNFHQRRHDIRVHACPYQIVSARDWDNLKHDTTRIVSAPSQCGTTQARSTNSRASCLRLSQHHTVRARDFSARLQPWKNSANFTAGGFFTPYLSSPPVEFSQTKVPSTDEWILTSIY